MAADPPTPSITLAPDAGFEAHPLALNPANAASDMVRLARIGRGELYDAEWSPDGKYLAVSTGVGVYLYDGETLEELRLIDVNEPSTVIDFSPDGGRIAVARETRVGVWSVETGTKVAEMEGEIAGGIWAMDFGGGNRIAAIGQISPGLGTWVPQSKVWDAADGELLQSEDTVFSTFTYAVAFNADGTVLVAPDSDWIGDLSLASTGITPFNGWLHDAIFSQNGDILVISIVWDDDPVAIRRTNLLTGDVLDFAQLSNCTRLDRSGNAAICYDLRVVHRFDLNTGAVTATLNLPEDIENAAIHPDGSRLAVVSGDVLRVLDIQSGATIEVKSFPSFDSVAIGIVRLEGADVYAAAYESTAGAIGITDLGTGETVRTLAASDSAVTGIAFSPDRRTLASLGSNGLVRLWDLGTGEPTYTFDVSGFTDGGPLQFSPDGSSLVLAPLARNGVISIGLETGEVVKIGAYELPYSYASNMPFQILNNGEVGIWRFTAPAEYFSYFYLPSGEERRIPYRIEADAEVIDWAAVNGSGDRFAAGTVSGTIFVWRSEELETPTALAGHVTQFGDGFDHAIFYLGFSPHNDLLLSVGWDQTTRLWNIDTGNFVRLLDVCCYAAFSPDGRLLVTAGDGVIRVWGIPPWP